MTSAPLLPAVLARHGVPAAQAPVSERTLRLASALSGWSGAALCLPDSASDAPCGSLSEGSPCADALASGSSVSSGPAPAWLSIPLPAAGGSLCLWDSSTSSLPAGVVSLLEDLAGVADSELFHASRSARLERALLVEARAVGVDALTGLLNRQSLEDALADALARCDLTVMVALTFLDLDGFKPVNDTFGHAAGDELLRLVSARLARVLRPGDLLGRFGGDEFVAICPGMTEAAVPSLVARLRSVFSTPFLVEGREVVLGTSLGVALGSSDTDPFELLRQADAAMYEDKRSRQASSH